MCREPKITQVSCPGANETKSKADSPLRLKFLGFALHTTGKGRAGIRIHEKFIDRFKNKIRELTRRNQGHSPEYVLQKLRQYAMGWLNDYAIADMKDFMQQANGWIKRKIRCYIWMQWKRIKTRFENLQALGVPRGKAWEWANTRKGYWHISNSWILSKTLTDKRIIQMGYDDIFIRYNELHSSY